MIHHTLEFLKTYLDTHLDVPGNPSFNATIDNIATIGDKELGDPDCVVLTLVNIEEEFTKKNYPALRKLSLSGDVEYINPPVFLNLYVLISAFTDSNYRGGLAILSDVIACLQSKNSFTLSNTGFNLDDMELTMTPEQEQLFKIDLELYTMTFEQLNHLWGTLGGKQYPSVMYKVRLVQLEKELTQGRGALIQEVTLNPSVQ